jgi:hypothetical protein
MSDRIHSFTVVLEDAIHEDSAREIAAAIGIIRGVVDVVPHVAEGEFYIAREQAKTDLRRQLAEVLFPRRT